MKWWLRFLDGELRWAHLMLRVMAIGAFALIVARWIGAPISQFAVAAGWIALGVKTLVKLAELITFGLRRGTSPRQKPEKFNSYKAIAHTELRIYRWFMASWKLPSESGGGYSFSAGPIYGSLVYVLWFSFLIEIPFIILITHLVPSLKPYALIADVCALIFAVYVLVIFRADKFAIRHTAHRITDDQLVLALGIRVDGRIALRDIVDVGAVLPGTWSSRARTWRLAGHEVARVSPLDKPNVVLEVAPGCATLTWMHGMTTSPRYIGLYLDSPARFIAGLHAARGRLDADAASSLLAD